MYLYGLLYLNLLQFKGHIFFIFGFPDVAQCLAHSRCILNVCCSELTRFNILITTLPTAGKSHSEAI